MAQNADAGEPAGHIRQQRRQRDRHQDRADVELELRVQQSCQQDAGKGAGQQPAHESGHRAQGQEFDRENPCDLVTGAAERLQNHHFANAPEAGSRDARRQNDGASQNSEGGEKPDHQRDLIDDLLNGLKHVRDVDHGHRREFFVNDALQLSGRRRRNAHAPVEDHGKPG